MLTRTPRNEFWRFARRAVDLVLRRRPESKWIDDVTPAWVNDGLLHSSVENTILDVSGAFDESSDH